MHDDPRPQPALPDLSTVTAMAEALVTTVGTDRATAILLTQFGWDLTFSALAQISGPHGGRGMWLALLARETSPPT